MKTILFMIFCLIPLIGLWGCGQSVTITYKVIDEQGLPIAEANVHAGYSTGGGWSGRPERNNSEQGKTSTDGFFVYKARARNEVGAKVSKEGFYDTYSKTVKFWEFEAYKSKNNPLIVILKKKINPVPMFAKHVDTAFPISEGSVGYDLMAGDFVEPYGSGKVKDFIFHIPPNKQSNINITFSNIGDGIQPFFVQNRDAQESRLKSDHNAPVAGYLSSLIDADDGWKDKYKTMGERAWLEEVNYYFRVRSKKSGKPLYGKIYGFFRNLTYGDPPKPHIEFIYYLNPDETNNVEYSGKSFFPSSSVVGFQNPPGMP